MVEMAKRMGAEVLAVEADWGSIVPPEGLIEALRAHPDTRVLAVVHAETSTGARQPLEEIGAAVSRTDTLLLVRIVGMKRRLGLHGNVVAESPHTYRRAHRLATGRIPGGQPPWRS